VVGVLTETGLDPNYLELEITESLLMEDIKANSRLLDELKTSVEGLRVSIDDFGTGYSSLSYLKTFPIDLLKIDQSFIRDITTNSDDAAITTTIIVLAHNLRLKVIAEGVETEEQMTYLREKGCDEAQGFYFSRPLPADEFTKLLVRGGSLLGVSC
jgi:EAL domain-containing protein (putative c-di-GMP-specific phosphodiesterase class I)